MHFKTLIAAAGLAATSTTAFLLPPEISASDNDIVNSLPVAETASLPASAEAQSLALACPGCPVQLRHHKSENGIVKIKTDIPSHLELNFTIDHGSSSSDRLLVNGFELYPNADPFSGTLSAPLYVDFKHKKHHNKNKDHKEKKFKGKEHKNKEHKKRPHHFKGGKHQPTEEVLGFGLATKNVPTDKASQLELVSLELQIIEVGNLFVDGIPSIEINLIKLPAGGLAIGKIEASASQKTPMDKQAECTTLLCKWRAMLMHAMSSLRTGRPCTAVSEVASPAETAVDGKPAHGMPHHAGHVSGHHHHGHHAHHAHKHNLGQLLKYVGTHILLPIVAGIMFGVGASALGMMVGTAIVAVWRRCYRSKRQHRHCRSAHKAARYEAAAADEKAGLMAAEEAEAPPAYADEVIVAEDVKDVKEPDTQA